jgi:hypothetical protein
MKIQVEMNMTPDEARRLMGLPDVSKLQDEMVKEISRRMKAAVDTSDLEGMMRAWMPLGGKGFEQFQKFLWDSARTAASGGAASRATKTER